MTWVRLSSLHIVVEQGRVWLRSACALDALSNAQLCKSTGNIEQTRFLVLMQRKPYLRVSKSELLQCQVK